MASTLTYSVSNQWSGGFIGNLAVQGGAGGLNGWTIAFDAGFEITNLWGAEIVSHVGTRYVLRSLSWNAVVPPDGTVSLGFQAAGSAASLPQGLSLNGMPTTGGDTPPALSITDASVMEGGDGTRELVFTVTLDRAAATAVTVNYATTDGTAAAGVDYTALQGQLTFAAGETSRTIRVKVLGDTAVEADETLLLRLSAPSGATLADAEATGTIRNDDTAPPPPRIAIGDASVVEGDPAGTGGGGGAAGALSTRGNQIVDAGGQAVKLAGVNWFGLESANLAPHGLWARGYKEMMDQMKAEGFNTIRLPFSSELLHSNAAPNGIDFSKSPELQGLSGLQVMDRIIDYAGQIGLRIILDHHRNSAGAGTSGNGLWYEAGYSEAQWIADWSMLAARYAGKPAVVGADLHNEPYNGNWGGGGANDWAAAAERAGNAVLAANPDWLIIVEGIGTYQGSNYWWGGNLMGARDRPIQLSVADKLVYSAHDYPNSIHAQPWFQQPGFEGQLAAKFDQMWGYLYRENIAPVLLGEFGTKLQDPKDLLWLEAITGYLSGDLDLDGDRDIAAGQQGASWTWWSWNPNSGDTGGILADDWRTVIEAKMQWLEPLQFDLGDLPAGGETDGCGRTMLFTVTLSAPAAEAVLVDWTTQPGTAGLADFTAAAGTLRFEAGETSRTIAVAIAADVLHEADETFSVVLSNPRGATAGDMSGTGTILDDDAVAPPPPPPVEDGGLEGSVSVVNAWAGGFQASVALTNEGSGAVQGWQLRIDTPYEITQIWNAEIVSHDAAGYVIRNAAWNGGIAEDATVSFGFLGQGAGALASLDLVL
ncbi:cellulase family glycosylhydrolase [Teichococcus aestuarii]|uniref:cellulase family glycosylhydrolase n=1 Tax=Teichococcus aestuarii TaxID=568898 RepID=UPI001C6271A5|nr:cellulase family glycosylhydrolase [Pseudoroseomonas aestuarii]